MKSNEEALEVILEAIGQAGCRAGIDIGLALDPAASEFYDRGKGKYVFKSPQPPFDKGGRGGIFLVHGCRPGP